jgi:hypothetical protein
MEEESGESYCRMFCNIKKRPLSASFVFNCGNLRIDLSKGKIRSMKTLLFSAFVLLACCLRAQVTVRVSTTDQSTRENIHRVEVKAAIGGTEAAGMTNMEGLAYFSVNSGDTIRLSTLHQKYTSGSRELVAKGRAGDTITISFRLKYYDPEMLPEFVVRPIGVPREVFSSKYMSVDDFEFLPDGRMVLLTYEKTRKKGTQLYLYDGKTVLSTLPLQQTAEELIRDYRGNPHVVTEKSVYGIEASNALINVGELDRKYFFQYIAPIVDSTVSNYFFSNYNPDYPAFDYFAFNDEDTAYRKIAQVKDDLMMELYRSEYKWVDVRTKLWAKELEHRTGIDAEIWVGANYFTQSVYYKKLYAPLFKRNDTIFLFDHYKNYLFSFDDEGNAIDSIPIFYHLQAKQTGWKKQLIQDQTTGEIYSVYERDGWTTLKRIDLYSGRILEAIPAHYKYAEKFLVRGNRMYYTYRPFESAQKKYLYEEVLPFGFPQAAVGNGDEIGIH